MGSGRNHDGATIDPSKIVSVIIPVYNTEEYIDDCVESVICQKYPYLDIILINDGSTDHSGEKCSEWKRRDARIRFFDRENYGLGATRNFGIEKAYGNYIMFLDSDDWVSSDFVDEMYRTIIQADADFVFCDYTKYDAITGGEIPFLTKLYTEEIIKKGDFGKLIYGSDVAMWTKIYRKALFVENKICIPDGPYEDTATYPIIIALSNRIVHLKKRLLFYRINREGSILNKRSNRIYAIDALRNVIRELKVRGLYDKYEEELERFLVRFVSYSLREMGDELKKEKEELVYYLKSEFSNIERVYAQKFLTIGSNNLYCIANQIPYDLSFTEFSSMNEIIAGKVDIGRFDCILLDFQENSLEQSTICKKDLNNMAFLLRKTKKQIICVQNRLAKGYGQYGSENMFVQETDIDRANKIIMAKENEFRSCFAGELKVVMCDNETLCYTDIHSRHGCLPFHLNDSYFLDMADRVIDVMKRLSN